MPNLQSARRATNGERAFGAPCFENRSGEHLGMPQGLLARTTATQSAVLEVEGCRAGVGGIRLIDRLLFTRLGRGFKMVLLIRMQSHLR